MRLASNINNHTFFCQSFWWRLLSIWDMFTAITQCFTRLLLSKRFIAFQWEVIYKMPQQPTCEGWKSCQPWWKHNTAMTHTYLYTHTHTRQSCNLLKLNVHSTILGHKGKKNRKKVSIFSCLALFKDNHSHKVLQYNNQSPLTHWHYSELVQSLTLTVCAWYDPTPCNPIKQ